MNALKQAMFVALAVGLVAGVTFLSNYTYTPSAAPKVALTASKDAEFPLRFAVNNFESTLTVARAIWDPAEPQYPAETGMPGEGKYRFWFENHSRSPVTITLKQKSCRCAYVDVLSFPAAGWSYGHNLIAFAGLLNARGGLSGPDILRPFAMAQLQTIAGQAGWHRLQPENPQPVLVQPADDSGPGIGILQMAWECQEAGPRLHTAEVLAQSPASPQTAIRLEVPTMCASVLRLTRSPLDVGVLSAGGSTAAETIIYSASRSKFTIRPRLEVSDPCISVADPVPLNENEIAELQKELRRNGQEGMRVRAAQRLRFRVSESVGETQLELGNFSRILVLDNDQKVELKLAITGQVRGDVRVIGGDEQGRIMLGNFAARNGVVKAVTLQATRPDVKLTVNDGLTSRPLKATLTPAEPAGALTQWKLAVEIAPHRAAGMLPAGTAVILTTDTGRKLRIPVAGNAES